MASLNIDSDLGCRDFLSLPTTMIRKTAAQFLAEGWQGLCFDARGIEYFLALAGKRIAEGAP